MRVRLANIDDLGDIMAVEEDVYGRVGEEVTATEQVMRDRILNSTGWFWLAEKNGEICGFLSLQPTVKGPQDFKNWEESTDKGTLHKTFNSEGRYVYGVALTVRNGGVGESAPAALFIQAARKIVRENKELAYFSARMPSYHRHKETYSPEEYFAARKVINGKEISLDPQIRFYESYGFKKARLVPDGYPDDWQSGGYGVIFVYKNKFYNRKTRHLAALSCECLLRMNLTNVLLRLFG